MQDTQFVGVCQSNMLVIRYTALYGSLVISRPTNRFKRIEAGDCLAPKFV